MYQQEGVQRISADRACERPRVIRSMVAVQGQRISGKEGVGWCRMAANRKVGRLAANRTPTGIRGKEVCFTQMTGSHFWVGKKSIGRLILGFAIQVNAMQINFSFQKFLRSVIILETINGFVDIADKDFNSPFAGTYARIIIHRRITRPNHIYGQR